MRFDGITFIPERDEVRLTGQLARVWDLMLDGKWRTLREIADSANATEASVSARLRDMRKQRFGSHEIEREHISTGLFKYRLIPNKNSNTSIYKQSHNETGVTL
jgi:hypothetical protein